MISFFSFSDELIKIADAGTELFGTGTGVSPNAATAVPARTGAATSAGRKGARQGPPPKRPARSPIPEGSMAHSNAGYHTGMNLGPNHARALGLANPEMHNPELRRGGPSKIMQGAHGAVDMHDPKSWAAYAERARSAPAAAAHAAPAAAQAASHAAPAAAHAAPGVLSRISAAASRVGAGKGALLAAGGLSAAGLGGVMGARRARARQNQG